MYIFYTYPTEWGCFSTPHQSLSVQTRSKHQIGLRYRCSFRRKRRVMSMFSRMNSRVHHNFKKGLMVSTEIARGTSWLAKLRPMKGCHCEEYTCLSVCLFVWNPLGGRRRSGWWAASAMPHEIRVEGKDTDTGHQPLQITLQLDCATIAQGF